MSVTADTLDDLHIQRVRADAKRYLRTWRRRSDSSQKHAALAHYTLILGYCDVAAGGVDTKTCRLAVARDRVAVVHNNLTRATMKEPA